MILFIIFSDTLIFGISCDYDDVLVCFCSKNIWLFFILFFLTKNVLLKIHTLIVTMVMKSYHYIRIVKFSFNEKVFDRIFYFIIEEMLFSLWSIIKLWV